MGMDDHKVYRLMMKGDRGPTKLLHAFTYNLDIITLSTLYMHMHVHTHACTCTYTCMYMYIHMHVHVHVQ